MSFHSSFSSWTKTVLHHSGHCGWIPYLWEKLLETSGLKGTHLAKFCLLNHPSCCTTHPPSLAKKQTVAQALPISSSLCKMEPPKMGRGEVPQPTVFIQVQVSGSSVSRWCPHLVAGEDSGCLVQNQTLSPTSTNFSSTLFSPSLSTHPYFHSFIRSFIQQIVELWTGSTCFLRLWLTLITVLH